jgi:hypothetical protein
VLSQPPTPADLLYPEYALDTAVDRITPKPNSEGMPSREAEAGLLQWEASIKVGALQEYSRRAPKSDRAATSRVTNR